MKPIRSILAAVDLGPATRVVLGTATTLAAAADARLHVVHAIELDVHGFPEGTPTFRALTQRSEKDLQKALQRWVKRVRPESIEMILYSRHRSIARRAKQVRAGLIVIGAHGKKRELLGTTADRLLRTTEIPVWIAVRALRLPIKSIVVATDLSTAGQSALDAAAFIVQQFGSARKTDVTLLHVYMPALQAPLVKELSIRLEDAAAGWVARYDLDSAVRVHSEMTKSFRPSDGLLGYLRRHPTDLLVLGTHGRSAIDRMLIGSVATRVLRQPPCNALAVPPERVD